MVHVVIIITFVEKMCYGKDTIQTCVQSKGPAQQPGHRPCAGGSQAEPA